jgi:hypothetical protein
MLSTKSTKIGIPQINNKKIRVILFILQKMKKKTKQKTNGRIKGKIKHNTTLSRQFQNPIEKS